MTYVNTKSLPVAQPEEDFQYHRWRHHLSCFLAEYTGSRPKSGNKNTRSSPQCWSGRSTIPHDVLNLWSSIYDPSVWGTWGSGWTHSEARLWVPISSPLTHMVYLFPFSSCLTGSKSASVRPPPGHPSVRSGYNDKYHSRIYSLVEWQKCKITTQGSHCTLALSLPGKSQAKNFPY